MVALTDLHTELTLDAADAALEEREHQQPARPYLGMSGVGRADVWGENAGQSCERQMWYQFRWAAKVRFDAATLKMFEDGHRTEALIADRLRMVPGISLITHDPATGGQIGYRDVRGHFRGHLDGTITGILEAPKTEHVWENKCCERKQYSKIKRLITKFGAKNALREWSPAYYAQAQLYMKYSGLTRHYMTVASAGGREWLSLRTEFNEVEAQRQIAKARRVIDAASPPDKISKAPGVHPCKWCDFADQCHNAVWSDINCRTCLHSTPVDEGQWLCERWHRIIAEDDQRQGCPTHKYIPDLVPGEVTGADSFGVTYQLWDGRVWRNGEDGA